MKCERTAHSQEVTDFMLCAVCHARQKVTAIETREWKVKCNECSFARYTGQDRDSARLRGIRHRTATRHTDYDVAYCIHPSNVEYVKTIFGRKVKRYIGLKTTNKVLFNPAILYEAKPFGQPELDDKPPF